jgi:exonuclease SbcD
LTNLLTASIQELDPNLPAILAAHVWVEGARTGSERGMMVGREPVLLPSNVANPALDYVALGHLHRHQVLSHSPPVVYSGSLERLDFSEEEDEKGFCVVEIGRQGGASFEFHKVPSRRFLTIKVDLDSTALHPTSTVLQAISRREEEVREAIVRVQVSVPESNQGLLQEGEIHKALKEAHFTIIAKEVKRESRIRLGGWSAEEITPIEALKDYLKSKKTSPDRTRVLLEYGERLLQEEMSQEGNE